MNDFTNMICSQMNFGLGPQQIAWSRVNGPGLSNSMDLWGSYEDQSSVLYKKDGSVQPVTYRAYEPPFKPMTQQEAQTSLNHFYSNILDNMRIH
jgi:hypothetical protein